MRNSIKIRVVATVSAVLIASTSVAVAANHVAQPASSIEVSDSNVVTQPGVGVGIDPIITGGQSSGTPAGTLELIENCDADCQAKRLGITFD